MQEFITGMYIYIFFYINKVSYVIQQYSQFHMTIRFSSLLFSYAYDYRELIPCYFYLKYFF